MQEPNQPNSSEQIKAPYTGVDRRRHPRVEVDTSSTRDADDAQPQERQQFDRRQSGRRKSDGAQTDRRQFDRRITDSLRDKVHWSVAPNKSNSGLLGFARSILPQSMIMKPTRFFLLLIALLSGGVAATLATQSPVPTETQIVEPVTQFAPIPKTQILVSKTTIGLGQRLTASSISWEEWPSEALRSDYITRTSDPDANSDLVGAAVRFEIFPGEPIRLQKLVQADQGYLSAILEQGLRGVSVSVSAESASGGFIVPNDHVDVVATRTNDFGQDSETILRNVRVLAINHRLGEMGKSGAGDDPSNPRAQIFVDRAIATLELNSTQAELIIGASAGGQLSLVLLSITEFQSVDDAERRGVNAAIRLKSAFWQN